ncbi:TlpA disulfide reductase family protein [Acidiluteibacter ferrifornacis]|uniref:Redoxin domain-containing protein n=1 Tax=Acidiluteibacter ferrifornacis TaxID=2692424 RepID=A0A6N9NLM6_9FLAO|nr:TlpA disulfide reductase family protein [Acidiluteibacter ferrifornacis]MBR9833155.1 AhpC/TSA family protein [bacterium]NBG66772.1 redoxin domain-containing protein [Acidiluteibacter ferrifornacis]
MKTIISGLIGIAFLTACGTSNQEKVDVQANIKNYNNPQVILEKLAEGKVTPIDTSTVDPEGNFSFDGSVDEKSFYRLNFNNQGFVFFVSSPDEQIVVNLDANNYRDYTITGSEDAVILHEFNKGLTSFYYMQDSLNRAFSQYQNHPKKDSIIQVFRGIYLDSESKKAEFVRNFLDAHSDSYAAMAIVEQLDKDNALDYYIKVKESLGKKYPQNKTFIAFSNRVNELSKLKIGSQIPEINLPSPNGNNIPLSSLRGKYVLVDFWASWCKPCRMENPNIVAEYNKYKSQGFTVYGVSLDREKKAWTDAIAADKLDWSHVSDLSFWNSEVVPQFGIEGIPFSILIDKEGKIVAKNLRGPALGRKLAEIFN